VCHCVEEYKNFVLTVADHYACGLWHNSGVDRNSTSLDVVDDADDRSRHEYLAGSCDRFEDTRIDDHAIQAIIKHIEYLPNHKRISRQHAGDMLETLVESVERDAGIGVDELEAFHANEPAGRTRRTRQARYRLERRPQEACRQYRANMCQTHQMNLKQLYNAQALLRQATKQAIREGCFGIPCRAIHDRVKPNPLVHARVWARGFLLYRNRNTECMCKDMKETRPQLDNTSRASRSKRAACRHAFVVLQCRLIPRLEIEKMSWVILFLLGAIWGASYVLIKIGGSQIPPFTFVELRTLIAALALILFLFGRALVKALGEVRTHLGRSNKVGGAEIPPFTFVEIRTLLAATALFFILKARREALPHFGRGWLVLIAMGIFNGVIPYTLITWGELYITSALAAILTAAVPLFTVILAHFWTHDEQLTAAKVVGVVVGLVGVAVLFLPELQWGIYSEFWGGFAVVVASASYATATLVARKYLCSVSHVVAAAGQLASAALLMLPLSLAFDNPFALRPSLVAMGSLAILALLGTAVAYILYYWLIEHTGATRTSLVTYVIPITGVMWGALLLHESIGWEALLGLALIIGGIGLVNRASATS